MIEGLVDPQTGADSCPHLAVLLKSHDELPAVLASFYALGAKRNGWLAHRSLPGESDLDRERLSKAGLQVAELEEEGRMEIMEIDPEGPAEGSTERLERALDEALERASRPPGTPASRSAPARTPIPPFAPSRTPGIERSTAARS